jgi:DNA-binding MarR family transcriptional regulator
MALPSDTPNMAELLLRASAQVNGTLTVRLRPLGLQVDEMRVLRALKTEGGRAMGGLAEELVISGPTLTKMVDRLVSNNLAYRAQDPDDRRRVRLYLTTDGEEVAAEADRIAVGYQSELAQSFGDDPQLRRMLGLLIDAIR